MISLIEPTEVNAETAFFTICSNNYIPMAKVWLKSVQSFYPNAKFFIFLADELIDIRDFYPENCSTVPASQIGIDKFNNFAFRYNILEFNTAIKPSAILYLLNNNFKNVLYFDPDIKIFNPLNKIFQALKTNQIVLTPHLTKPLTAGNIPNDFTIMSAGVYNLGFIAVSEGKDTRDIVQWWRDHLQYHCIIDFNNGIFVDQKFIDLVPGYSDKVYILRDTEYNVAYWNLHQRVLRLENNTIFVDGQPLAFYHFSGFNINIPNHLSKYTTSYRDDELSSELKFLLNEYASELRLLKHGSIPMGIYSYGKFKSGVQIPMVVREMFRTEFTDWPAGQSPFDTLEEYLHLPSIEWATFQNGHLVNNLLSFIHKQNDTLKFHFPTGEPNSASNLANWFVNHGINHVNDRRLVEPTVLKLGHIDFPIKSVPKKLGNPYYDISIIGYHNLALEQGEIAHQILKTLHLSGSKVCAIPITLDIASDFTNRPLQELLVSQAATPVQIFCINPDQYPEVLKSLKNSINANAYRIIIPFWDLEVFPEKWLPAFDLADEVWTPSNFIQAMLAPRLQKPVIRMPVWFDLPSNITHNKSKWNIDEESFVFYCSLDNLSFPQIKNPLAVVNAFEKLVHSISHSNHFHKTKLLIKSTNKDKLNGINSVFEKIQSSNILKENIIEIDEALSKEDTLSLMASCNAVISLHRSEGLDIVIPQAMALGLPVIATDYAASSEFVNPETAWPVDFQLKTLEEGDYPEWNNQLWAEADVNHATWLMLEVLSNPKEVSKRTNNARKLIDELFNLDNSKNKVLNRLKLITL